MELAKYSGSWLTRLCGQSAWVHQPRLIQCSREVDRKKQRYHAQVDQVKWSCTVWLSFGLQRKSMSRGHFLVEFEVLWSTLELPDHLFQDTSKQGRKVIKNDVKMEAVKHV